ncbi:MAG: hydrogenase maturation protease [Gemmatimonadota bacterium]
MAGSPGRVRIIALGNRDRGDDGAALLVAERFTADALVIPAGRPGADLMDLLPPEEPCILLDVTLSGSPPGTIHEMTLESLDPHLLPDLRISSHGFGPGEALALAKALGRPLPEGMFLGIEGESFELGAGLSPPVSHALPHFEERVRRALGIMKGIRQGS